MKKISRRSFMAAAAVSVAALALTACGGSASSAASSVASSAASSEAASSAATAELTTVEAGKLTMATNAAFPPYEMTTDAGEFEGIDVDTAKAIAEKLGLELQIDDMDFDAALLSVQQGKADIVMAGVTVTDERKAVMDFSDSYATGIQSVIVPEGSDIASVDDLAGKKRNSVAPDLPDYIMEPDYVSAALRTARDLDASEADWLKFVEELRQRKG